MRVEIKALEDRNTWTVVDAMPRGKKALPCKWVYKVKRNAKGEVDKLKARLVAVGSRQREGYDYHDTHAPVARQSSIR